jgi:hypothetical protein
LSDPAGHQKAMRISRAEQALRTSYVKNPNVKIAVEDFETLIGNCYGELNERLASFLEEFCKKTPTRIDF